MSKPVNPDFSATVASEVKKQLGPLEEFLKTLAGPASRVGMTPEQFLAKATDHGQTAGVFGPNGQFLSAQQLQAFGHKPKSLGWGDMLTHMVNLCTPGASMESVQNSKQKLFAPVKDGGYGMEPSNTKAALAEGSGTTGGYTVPPQFANTLQTLSIEKSIVEPLASKMPMTGRQLSVPSLDYTGSTAGQSPYLGGVVAKWTSEAATRDETEPTFRQTNLTAWELSFYTVASNNLLADNAVGLDSLLSMLFPAAIAWYTDYAYLQGDSVGKPQGIIGAAPTIAVSRGTASRVRWVDIVNMMSRLLMQSWESAVWVAHQSTLPDLLQMHDSSGNQTTYGAGRSLFVSIDQGAAKKFPMELLGLPLMFTEKVPALGTKGDIGLYDFSKYLLGKRMDVEIAVSPHVKFLNNQMVWRVVWRGDGRPWLSSAITQADGNSSYTVSPFVTLAA